MVGQKSNLEIALMDEKELKTEIFKDFASNLVEEVEKLIQERGKEEVLKIINQ